jgi:hypothetical protein
MTRPRNSFGHSAFMLTICLSYLEGEGNMGKSSILNCFKLAAQQGSRTDISLSDHLLVHCASKKMM